MEFTTSDLQLEIAMLKTKIVALEATRQMTKSTISSVLAELEILVQDDELEEALQLIREYK